MTKAENLKSYLKYNGTKDFQIAKLREYEKIGNLEECYLAIEKTKPEETKNCNGDYGICPACSSGVHRTDCYCSHCGKRLKWIDEKRGRVHDEK